jgi:hypothetical protein
MLGWAPSNYNVTPAILGNLTNLFLGDGLEKNQSLLVEMPFSYFLTVLTHVWESTLRTLGSVMLPPP